jgi:ribosome-binding protein aMBF1 (putative translation factor)
MQGSSPLSRTPSRPWATAGVGPYREAGQRLATSLQHDSRDFTLEKALVNTKLGGMTTLSDLLYKRFRDNLRTILESRGMSQKELAGKLGNDPSFVSLLLNGHCRPGLDTLEKVARALEIDAAKLISRPRKHGHGILTKSP